MTVQLVSQISDLCDPDPPTLQTDRRTDRQTTCDRNTALCTKVHRAVKIRHIIETTISTLGKVAFWKPWELRVLHQKLLAIAAPELDAESGGACFLLDRSPALTTLTITQ